MGIKSLSSSKSRPHFNIIHFKSTLLTNPFRRVVNNTTKLVFHQHDNSIRYKRQPPLRLASWFFSLLFFIYLFFSPFATISTISQPPNHFYQHSFLPSSYGRVPAPPVFQSSPSALNHNRIHVAFIFDSNRANFTQSLIRSITYYTDAPLTLHLITPIPQHSALYQLPKSLPGNVQVALYDHALCLRPSSLVWHISKNIHLSAMCKPFLPEIIPVPRVLYIDSDSTVVQDIAKCWFSKRITFTSQQYIAMGVDMGEKCQHDPDLCYPIGMNFLIPDGLKCATTPHRADYLERIGKKCRQAGETEPYQFNGGVVLMHLQRMRLNRFTTRFVQASIHTWRTQEYKPAKWGEQDLLNNFFRLYPSIVATLPCGCNYQYSAPRRDSKCANQSVIIAHSWSAYLKNSTCADQYNLHFNFFRRSDLDLRNAHVRALVPNVSTMSHVDKDWQPPSNAIFGGVPIDVALRSYDPLCRHQRVRCSFDDNNAVESTRLDIMEDTVNIITRTSNRPVFFSENVLSVQEQLYPNVKHVVGTDDLTSFEEYLTEHPHVILLPSIEGFDFNEVCRMCPTSRGKCANAPPLGDYEERQRFFDCYCSTIYPMNEHMNKLHKHITPGWILYLDDDNLLKDKWAINSFLASLKSRQPLVAFRSHLGRLTPTDENFEKKRIMMGDFDSSNFAFHSNNIHHAVWDKHRCGDFRVSAHLDRILPSEWVNLSFIQANPMQEATGGMGKKQDVGKPPVTVVITSHQATGWRRVWLKQIIDSYTDSEMDHIVKQVLLVWNNPNSPMPQDLVSHTRLKVIKPSRNSLNNRWIQTLPHIHTDIVLNLDDDIYVKKEGLICMLNWLKREPDRMIGPFVRRIEQEKYVLDELHDSSAYSVVLPRILLVPTFYLEEYAKQENRWFHDYVDNQEAHCDDIFLNMVALKMSNKPPLRALLPEGSVIDFYNKCWKVSKELTGGLGTQANRTKHRSTCVKEMMNNHQLVHFKDINHIATCLPRGNAMSKRENLQTEAFHQMLDENHKCDGELGVQT